MEPSSENAVPVTILTGFLGSGKTTLLNWILSKNHGKKIAVIENEFGSVGVDDELVKSKVKSSEAIIELMNGCICCTVRSDLSKVIKEFIAKGTMKTLDSIIIETTGLADPAPVCQTFFVDEEVAEHTQLDAVVTVVDAKHIVQHLDEEKPDGAINESVQQIAFADKVILNKIDLVDAEELAKVESRITGISKHVDIIKAQLNTESVPLDQILGLDAFSLDKVLESYPGFLEDEEHDHDHTDDDEDHDHDDEDHDHDDEHDDDDHNKLEHERDHHKRENKSNGSLQPKSTAHQHDKSVSSASFNHVGDVSINKLQMWIRKLIVEKGNDLYRYKGVLSVKGFDKKFVFQGIHMMFSGNFSPDTEWGESEERKCKFVFIGKHLNKEEFTKGFEDCLLSDDLRFKVGDAVKARVEEGYREGKILKLWDEGNPYRVRLDNGVEVWALEDDDKFIMPA